MEILKNIKEFINDFKEFRKIRQKQHEKYMQWTHKRMNIPMCRCSFSEPIPSIED